MHSLTPFRPRAGRRPPASSAGIARAMCAALMMLSTPAAGGAQEPPAPCTAPEYRQFDFWLGSWEVRDPGGEIAGTNEIRSVVGGCALHERWEGAGGGIGESLNAYDHRTGSWHQTWVGGRGLVLRLEGGLRDGSMVLEGELTEDGQTILQRITWTPSADGSVTQLWETSEDGGDTWSTAFNGTYRKVAPD